MIWYVVRDLEAARAFYAGDLEFGVESSNAEEGWVSLSRGKTAIGLREGAPDPEGQVAVIDVEDAKAEAEKLRARGVEVGVVLELHDQVRLVDVFDPDGNRLQLLQDCADDEPE